MTCWPLSLKKEICFSVGDSTISHANPRIIVSNLILVCLWWLRRRFLENRSEIPRPEGWFLKSSSRAIRQWLGGLYLSHGVVKLEVTSDQ